MFINILCCCFFFKYRIWDHLVHLTKDGGTTVIVTTHYIDETRQAHMVINICYVYLYNSISNYPWGHFKINRGYLRVNSSRKTCYLIFTYCKRQLDFVSTIRNPHKTWVASNFSYFYALNVYIWPLYQRIMDVEQIGLMRGGKFLAEESPSSLLLKYNCQSLEDVFLKLSVIQNRGKRRRSSILHDITAAIAVPVIEHKRNLMLETTRIEFDCFNTILFRFVFFFRNRHPCRLLKRWIRYAIARRKWAESLVTASAPCRWVNACLCVQCK